MRSRRRRSGGTLETGLGLAALGIFLLLLPVFMNSPLQQSALEPLEPMAWLMLLAGVAVCAWCFRPLSDKGAASESLAWLSRSSSPSRVTPDRKRKRKSSSGRHRGSGKSAAELPDDAERRAALKAAVKANVAKMLLPSSADGNQPHRVGQPMPSDSGFADTVLAMPGPMTWEASDSVPSDLKIDEAASNSPIDDEPFREAPPQHWNARVFQLIEWRRFEAVVEALFKQAGFKTRPQKHADAEGADGGVDIWLYSRHARKAVSVVQCKHWQGRPVTGTELKRFFNVMNSHGQKRGTYATTSTFTADAKAFAAENGIHAMDGAALLDLIQQRTPEQQAALLKIAFDGEYWRPTCSNCGVKLIQRGSAKNGSLFWGCENFPACRMRMPIAA